MLYDVGGIVKVTPGIEAIAGTVIAVIARITAVVSIALTHLLFPGFITTYLN
jgi:hypothetical protein